jgi:hypothetical protein
LHKNKQMKLRLYITIFMVLVFSLCASAGQTDSIAIRIENINRYQSEILARSPFNDEDLEITAYNDSLAAELQTLLIDKNLKTKKLKQVLDKLQIGKIASDDGKFWVFNWYANNGGTWHVYYEVLFAVLPHQNVYVSEVADGIGTEKVFTFAPSKNKKVYLMETSGRTCSSCHSVAARAYQIADTALVESAGFFDASISSLAIDARMGSIEEFGYNPETKKFRVKYISDDLTGDGAEENWGDTIEYEYTYYNGYLQFNKL